jgi:very-short-patch-repair endonuclease
MRPFRPPAFRDPLRGWVQWSRFPVEGARRVIEEANLRVAEKRNEEPMEPSPLEVDLLAALYFYGLTPLVQHELHGYRPDFYFEDARLAVEVDGRDWHDWRRDLDRDQHLARHGIKTLRFRGSEVWRDPVACAQATAKMIVRRLEEAAA